MLHLTEWKLFHFCIVTKIHTFYFYYHFPHLHLVVDLLLLEQFCSRCSLKAHLILPYSANCRLLSMSCRPYCFSTISNSSLWWLPSALIHLWFDASRKALIESSFTLFLLNSIFMCLKVNQFPIFCLLYFTICVYTVLILSLLQIHLWQWVSAPGRSQKESF